MAMTEQRRTYLTEYREKNREKIREYARRWRAQNRDKVKASADRWRLDNPEKSAEVQRKRYARWKRENPDEYRRRNAVATKARRRAQPKWLTTDQKAAMRDTYALARECGTITGDEYHVDHIVPIRGKAVCGLHVPWNLQVLPADVNMKKKAG